MAESLQKQELFSLVKEQENLVNGLLPVKSLTFPFQKPITITML
jgi:hypothetical protein